MEKNPQFDAQLPPGFRFHPSDEELIIHYLRNKVTKSPLPASIIADIELYKYNPWELPKKSTFGDDEWYFFTPRDRKYPNGTRPNRMAASGYWKATGIDKPILSSCGSKVIGVKKALVFYIGRPPRGNKTEWIMQEYRVPELEVPWSNKREKSMRLDDWVLCRVSQKTAMPGNMWEERNGAPAAAGRESLQFLPKMDKQYNNYVVQEASMPQRIPPKSTAAATDKTLPVHPSNPEKFLREYLNKEGSIFPTFLFSPPQDHQHNYPSIDSVNSCLSYETNNNNKINSENNFNLDYSRNPGVVANLGKRKLSFDSGHDEEMIFRDQNKKLAAGINNVPGQSAPPMYNINIVNPNVVNGMASYSTTTHMEKLDCNYNGEQMGPMYHDLYRLAFS